MGAFFLCAASEAAAQDGAGRVSDGGLALPLLLLGALAAIALVAALWWSREKRMEAQRRAMRAFHGLSKDIIAAGSPAEIAEKLVMVLPEVTQATGVRLYLFDRRTRSLECVPTEADPDPMAVPIDSPPEGLAGGAVACFRNRTLLNVPDVRRSPFVNVESKINLPRAAMFLPLLAENGLLGVLELSNLGRVGYFTPEEQSAAQHLANQVTASLKLQEQQAMREQLFRSEKLAATGQLISGVASELRAPIESILQLATTLSSYVGKPAREDHLRELASESQRASEIVSRLVSFAHPEDSEARLVDVSTVLAGLIRFREPEWKSIGLRVQNRLAQSEAGVLGAQGQIEQLFLNLLVHAEQCASESPGKTMTMASSIHGRNVAVEITYSPPENARDPFNEGRAGEGGAMGLSVCQSIARSHGGEIRFRAGNGTARFEVDLPLALSTEEDASAADLARPTRALTVLLVDPDPDGQRQLLGLLSARRHRVIPAPMEEAADLAQRLRFDAVLLAVRPGVARWSEFRERIRSQGTAFVLVSDGYDAQLALSLERGGGFLLGRPVKDAELDLVLGKIAVIAPVARPAR